MGIALLLKATGQTMPDSHALPVQPAAAEESENPENKPTNDAVTEDGSLASGEEQKKEKLMQMGFATALAIALHNFPEGLLAFVGYMEDPAVGIALAAGIAIHNI